MYPQNYVLEEETTLKDLVLNRADTTLVYNGNSEYKVNLMQYLPWYYQNSEFMRFIQNSNSLEVEKLKYNIDDSINQLFIDTATWGLDRLERIFNIETDINKSYEDRREVLKAKLIGSGTVTKEMIKNVVQAFSVGKVEVIENNYNYNFVIKFIEKKGIPKNIQGLINAIEEIKPAHLKVIYEFLYNTWNEVNIYTWGEVNRFTWDGLAQYEILYGLTYEQLSKMKEKELSTYKNNEMIEGKEV